MKTDLDAHIAEIARRILGLENKERSNRTELRFGTHGSVSVVIAGRDRGKWFDHENHIGGGTFELIRDKAGVPPDQIPEWLLREFGIDLGDPENRTAAGKRIVATYDYPDEQGRLLFQVVRYEPKDFRQRRPDGKGDWIWSTKGIRPVPYRLPELVAAPAEALVFVVEGEKDADRLAALGLVGTCNAGGAAKGGKNRQPPRSTKWRPGLNQFFRGRDVVLLPDNDDAGRDHAQAVAENLVPFARRVRIVELPGLLPKGDVSDWLDAGGTVEQLRAVVELASPVDSQPQERDDAADAAEIARLAKLPPIQYDRERPAAAKRLGCRPSIMDRLVAAARGEGKGNGSGQGRALDLPEHEPWPEAVSGDRLLSELSEAIRRHIVLAEAQADAVALWIIAVHAFEAFAIFPRLLLTAAEKGSGKSATLRVVSCLVPKPLGASNATASALFRAIEAARPTLLLDEADAYARDNEDLRSVLDAGHERGGSVLRSVGDDHEPRWFSVWAPVALAGIGHLPGTVEDRSIIIKLKRRRIDEQIETLRIDKPNGLDRLARMASRWAKDHAAVLTEADPAMPAGIINRAADNWRPLLAVADLAGGDWPAGARETATLLVGANEDQSRAVLLLADIRAAFESARADRLASEALVEYLVSLDDQPWPEFKNGKPITKVQVARIVKKFGVSSGTIRLDDGWTAKGYKREAFDDVFARYLPCENVTTSQPAENLGSRADSKTSQGNGCDVSESAATPNGSAACDGVTFPEPPFPENDEVEREERAAILEHDAGLSRAEAERIAGLSQP